MWSIKDLKEKGKAAMKANYGMALLVSIILSVVGGAATGASSGSSASSTASDAIKSSGLNIDALLPIIIGVLTVIVIALIISVIIDIVLFNPIIVGCQNFFIKNSDGPAELGELKRGFSPNWKGNVLTMFLSDLFLLLWFCLFLIPGFIKSYSYRLVPFLLAENPELQGTEAITLSRKMMNGNKWKAFCFDLSFIGWYILSIITCGLVGFFYVIPYFNCANAELYKAIRDEYGTVSAD